MDDVADRYARIAEAFTLRVTGCPPGSWSRPSPCPGWTARDVVAHVVEVHRRIVGAATGTEPQPVTADDDVSAAWAATTSGLMSVLANPEQSTATIPSPFGPMPAEQLVGRIVCTDTLVHTWDLARATGQDEM